MIAEVGFLSMKRVSILSFEGNSEAFRKVQEPIRKLAPFLISGYSVALSRFSFHANVLSYELEERQSL